MKAEEPLSSEAHRGSLPAQEAPVQIDRVAPGENLVFGFTYLAFAFISGFYLRAHFSERVWPTGPGDLPPAAPSLSGGTPTGQAASSQTPSEVWKICEQGRNMLGTKINDWCLGRGWGGSRQVPSGLQKRQQKILTPENGRGWWEVNRNG